MLQDVLTLGDKIDIRRLDKNGRPASSARTYVSQLIDFIDFDVIYIATPIMNSALIVLNVGENYQLCFYTNKGLYQCNCVILNNYKENNTVIAAVRITTNLEKFQRRQYYRLECVLEIEYRVITNEEEIFENRLFKNEFGSEDERKECENKLQQLQYTMIPAAIIDISGGGARFNSAVLHNQGDRVQMKFDLAVGSTLRRMELGADIITSGKIMNKSGIYEHRVEFNDISKRDREDLIKYIFEQERRRRRYDKN